MSECMSKEGYIQRIKGCQTVLRKISDSKVLGDGTQETWTCGITASQLLTDLLNSQAICSAPPVEPLTCDGCFYQGIEGANCCRYCKRRAPDCYEPEEDGDSHAIS